MQQFGIFAHQGHINQTVIKFNDLTFKFWFLKSKRATILKYQLMEFYNE